MITELEQCSCGVLFEMPLINNAEFSLHEHDGTHRRALAISVCGPCFVGVCSGCEKNRGTNVWRCRCTHSEMRWQQPSEARIHEITIVWSDWLDARCPSEHE